MQSIEKSYFHRAKYIAGLFNNLLRAVRTRSAPFYKRNTLFSTKTSKNTCCLGECSILIALNLEKMRGKNLQLCPFTGLFSLLLVIPHACFIF